MSTAKSLSLTESVTLEKLNKSQKAGIFKEGNLLSENTKTDPHRTEDRFIRWIGCVLWIIVNRKNFNIISFVD